MTDRRQASRPQSGSRKRGHGQTGLRWVIYLRQSKKRRDAVGRVTTNSIEIQEQACRERILHIDPGAAAIAVIVDHGRSGGRGRNRPGRDELLARIRRGQVDAVMAFKADRIGRDIEESEHLWNQCFDHGAFISALDCEDLSDPLLRSVFFGMAAKGYSDRQRYSKAAIERRRAAGKPPCKSGVAFGLRWVGDMLQVEPSEWPIVELIFRLFDEGLTVGAIARRLSCDKVPRRNRDHCQWDSSAISQKLRSTWYIGQVPDGDGYWDAGRSFIDPELFKRCQARLATRKHTGQELNHVLSGLLYCGCCQGWSPMSLCYSRYTRKDGSVLKKYRYRCIHHVRAPDFCPGQSIDARLVEAFLLTQLQAIIGGDELAQVRFARHQRSMAEAVSDGAEKHRAEAKQFERKQDELFARRQGGELIPDRIYNSEMQRLEDLIGFHRDNADAACQQAALSRSVAQRTKTDLLGPGTLGDDRWYALSASRRNEFLRLLFPDGLSVVRPVDGVSGRVVAPRLAVRSAQSEQAVNDEETAAG